MPLISNTYKLTYNSGEDKLLEDFYIPSLKNSIKYFRAVGFFTSQVLSQLAEGLDIFIKNDGVCKLICSPRLSREDIDAINKGYTEKEKIIQHSLNQEIENILDNLRDDPLNCLSWLISKGRMEIKIALPSELNFETYGIYHEKIGLFIDNEDNVVAFSGSNNETVSAIAYNYESFDVFCSWIDVDRCQNKFVHFNRLWDGTAKGVEILDFTEAVRVKILEKIEPQMVISNNILVKKDIQNGKKVIEFNKSLWGFQKEAIAKWKENSYCGILSMATGTGKTKTAISGVIQLLSQHEKILCVICCPQNSIIGQWAAEINKLDLFDKYINADSTNYSWRDELNDAILDSRLNDKKIIVYTTYQTFSNDNFIELIGKYSGPSMIICDEVHWSGASTFRRGLLSSYTYRLGLSATPQRYMDDLGTSFVYNYFGSIVYEFSIERALTEINPVTGQTFLCPFIYEPIFVALSEIELTEYYDITQQINRKYAVEIKTGEISEQLQRLFEKRQRIITNAEAKYIVFENLITNLDEIKFTLTYCSPNQIDRIQDILKIKSIVNHRFTGQEGTNKQKTYNDMCEREYILNHFEKGNYQMLVAMKCLDEGINITQAHSAILLASSGNPREHIQRCGRLLRRHQSKNVATIYDIIVVPYMDEHKAINATKDEKKILEKEMARYEYFAGLSKYPLDPLNKIFYIKKLYGLI